MEPELIRNPHTRRYVAKVDGRVIGFADYAIIDDVVVLPHTEVERESGGHGVGGQIVRFALDDIRERGLAVDPVCPFVKRYIELHPEYADLVRK